MLVFGKNHTTLIQWISDHGISTSKKQALGEVYPLSFWLVFFLIESWDESKFDKKMFFWNNLFPYYGN